MPIEMIPIEKIDPSPFQTRETMEPLQSAKEIGVMQPPVVRRKGERFEVVAGHRRLATLKALGKKEIQADIREFSDEEAADALFLENEDREGLEDSEKGEYFLKYMETFKVGQIELAKRLGVSQTLVSFCVGIARSKSVVIKRLIIENPGVGEKDAEALYASAITASKYSIVTQLPPEQRMPVFKELLSETFTDEQTQALVTMTKAGAPIEHAAATVQNAKKASSQVKRALELGRTSTWVNCPICLETFLMKHQEDGKHDLELVNEEDQ